MSLNTAHCNGGVLVHQGEVILLHASNTIISFSGSDDLKFGEKSGNAYLTTHRLIFLTGKGSASNSFQSFSFPFCVLSEVDVEQPMFGANYLKGKVRAQPDGNWRGEAKFKLVFKSGGAIEFAQGMVCAMRIAKQMTSQNAYWNTPPPSYSAATAPGSPYQQAPPTYYSSPTNNYYGWMPPAYNFPAPEAGTVFVTEAPPPYPGIGGQAPQQQAYYQQQPQPQSYYPQQQATNPYASFPPQNAGYPQQNGGYPPQNGGYPQQNVGYPQQNGAYPQQQYATSAAPPATGFYPPPNSYAYANGTQAFVPPPSSAPPPYDFSPADKKNN